MTKERGRRVFRFTFACMCGYTTPLYSIYLIYCITLAPSVSRVILDKLVEILCVKSNELCNTRRVSFSVILIPLDMKQLKVHIIVH